ncbi:MAG: hypothetical protein ACRD3O_08110, partial [Terriglobia bacterium]
TELIAAEVVSGSFRNIAGAVLAVNAGANEITVMDRIAKAPVVVKVTPDSELRQLPAATAQKIALELRGAPGSGGQAGPGRPAGAKSATPSSQPPASPKGEPRFSQIVSSLPPITVTSLRKGDVVMIVSTQGPTAGSATAIKLVSGVAPILTASTAGKRQSSAMRSLWSGFGASGGEGGAGAGGGGAPNSQ